MSNHRALKDLGILPRLLTREQAAAYCGVSVQTFSDWVKRGHLPEPLPGTHRWDLKAIDASLDTIGGIKSVGTALDDWKATRARPS